MELSMKTRFGWSLATTAFATSVSLFAGACAREAAWAPMAAPAAVDVAQPFATDVIASSTAQLQRAYGRLPLHFEENRGQMDAQVRFVGRAPGGTVYLTDKDIVLALAGGTLRLEWLGAQTPQAAAEDVMAGTVNYLVGADPARWRTDIPTFARVRYDGVYPGVNAVFYGNERRLEYDLVVEPGADPSRIAFQVQGADRIDLDGDGNLVMRMGEGTVVQHAPVVYQDGPRGREPVEARYVVRGRNRVSFRIGTYDRNRPLVIDPVVSYATFVGSPSSLEGIAITVDMAGNAYVTGQTGPGFPTTSTISPTGEIFVTKLNPAGSAMVYSTIIGGSTSLDEVTAIAVDSAGSAYITGRTLSTDFPVVNAFQPIKAEPLGSYDGFITKLNAAGNGLVYSTYIGGAANHGDQRGWAIAVDSVGHAYVGGTTASPNFPTTPGAFQTTKPAGSPTTGDDSGWVAKVHPSGTSLVYSTFLGGTGHTSVEGLAIDASGNVYVGGATSSNDFPTTAGAIKPSPGGTAYQLDGFVAKLNPTGSALVYSTRIGGSGGEYVFAIAVKNGEAYVTGYTDSTNFPTVNAFQPSLKGLQDAFVARLNATGTGFIYSTYLGGSATTTLNNDAGLGIAVDRAGSAVVVGRTNSSDFPVVNPVNTGATGALTGFMTQLSPAGALGTGQFSIRVGGLVNGVAIDSSDAIYATGVTNNQFVTTPGAVEPTSSSSAAFVLKLTNAASPPPPSGGGDTTKPTVSITSPSGNVWTGNSINIAASATDNVGLANIKLWGNGAVFATLSCSGTTCSGNTWWITGSLPPAAYEVNAVATDTAGNQTISAKVTIFKDATSPVKASGATVSGGGGTTPPPLTAAITSPAGGATVNGTVTVNMSASNVQGSSTFVLKLDNSATIFSQTVAGSTATTSWNTAGVPNGIHSLNLTVTDGAGRTASTAISVVVGPPLAAAITSPANGTTVSGAVTVNMTATNAVGSRTFNLKLDNGVTIFQQTTPASTATMTWNTAGVANGVHSLNLTLNDGGGRTASAAVSVTVSNTTGGGGGGDTTKPTVSITSPSGNVWTGNSINIAASATDNVALANIKLWGNGAVFATLPCSGATCSGNATWVTGSLPAAAYEVNAVATDMAGNQTISAKVTIFKDATSPVKPSGATGGGTTPPPLTATITTPANGATVSGNVTVSMTAGGASGTPLFELKVDNTNVLFSGAPGGTTVSTPWSTTAYANGTHTLNLKITDGARTATATVTVTVNNATGGGGTDTTPPTAAITSPPNGAWTGNSIDVTASATDNVLLSTLKFYGNGVQFGQLTCGTKTCGGTQWWVTGSLPSGKHTITVVATDTAGNQTTSAPVVINK
jgi:hypothetical protein